MCLLMKLLDVENVAESHAIGEHHNFQQATNDASLLHLVTENEFNFKFYHFYAMQLNVLGETFYLIFK